ncbi:hypothetical protein [Nonomuraea helvata]|uniref:Uncharacterized protein n=1 Tax=Nonomuraea helvata TaxID=37484 RepID=A0ABV5SI35_9ACTN
MLTINDIVPYTGLTRGTIDIPRCPGRIPGPNNAEHGVKRWKRSTIDDIMSKRRG